MKPLAAWSYDANQLDELAYCAKHPYPLLVHMAGGYTLHPVEKGHLTMDRAILSPVKRRADTPSALDDYSAVAVRQTVGKFVELTVGCDRKICDILINDITISRVHAHMLQDRHGNWYINDASSTTGTFVNDKDPLPTQVLVSGDRITFGMVDVTFYLPSQAFALIRRLV